MQLAGADRTNVRNLFWIPGIATVLLNGSILIMFVELKTPPVTQIMWGARYHGLFGSLCGTQYFDYHAYSAGQSLEMATHCLDGRLY